MCRAGALYPAAAILRVRRWSCIAGREAQAKSVARHRRTKKSCSARLTRALPRNDCAIVSQLEALLHTRARVPARNGGRRCQSGESHSAASLSRAHNPASVSALVRVAASELVSEPELNGDGDAGDEPRLRPAPRDERDQILADWNGFGAPSYSVRANERARERRNEGRCRRLGQMQARRGRCALFTCIV